jgi:RNA-directed DNA polymerase
VASPLLANVALHGLEAAVKAATGAHLVRYADDFVCFHPTREGIAAARQVIEEQLGALGLELHPTKTRIAHTLDVIEGQSGCDFLGFSIRQYRCGRYRSGRNGQGTLLGFKTLIKPSKEAVKRHMDHLRDIMRHQRAATQEELIAALNPVIRGWSAYHRTVVAKETFSRCDHLVSRLLWNWAHRRHAREANRWIKARYWRANGTWRWRFATPSGDVLALHAATPIKRHVKVRGTARPYDGNLLYWGQRLQHHPLTGTPLARALQRQKWRCAGCGLTCRDGDLIELDHIVPTTAGGTNDGLNHQAWHRHCHDTKTHDDGSRPTSTRGIL